MWWKWVLRAVLAVSQNEAVRGWVRRRAKSLIDAARKRAEARIADFTAMADDDPPADATPGAKVSVLVRTPKDTLRPGQVTLVDDRELRIIRLLSSNPTETVYEAEAAES